MKKISIIIIGLFSALGFSQEKQSETASILFSETSYGNHFFTLGPIYNLSESLIGIQVGNGNDEQPLIHFEDLTADILYKISGQTDFNKDYSIGSEISWNYPFRAKLSILTLNYNQSRFTDNDLFHRNIGLSTRYYTRFKNLSLLTKLSHQRLNQQNNLGFGLGLQNAHVGIFYGFRADYFKDYWNYSAFVQSLIFKDHLSLRLVYDRLENYDFFNIGLSYVFINEIEERNNR